LICRQAAGFCRGTSARKDCSARGDVFNGAGVILISRNGNVIAYGNNRRVLPFLLQSSRQLAYDVAMCSFYRVKTTDGFNDQSV
jgi:hypothetical protein